MANGIMVDIWLFRVFFVYGFFFLFSLGLKNHSSSIVSVIYIHIQLLPPKNNRNCYPKLYCVIYWLEKKTHWTILLLKLGSVAAGWTVEIPHQLNNWAGTLHDESHQVNLAMKILRITLSLRYAESLQWIVFNLCENDHEELFNIPLEIFDTFRPLPLRPIQTIRSLSLFFFF